MAEVAKQVENDAGKIDILVHSLANGPEVTKPLLETSRRVNQHINFALDVQHNSYEQLAGKSFCSILLSSLIQGNFA